MSAKVVAIGEGSTRGSGGRLTVTLAGRAGSVTLDPNGTLSSSTRAAVVEPCAAAAGGGEVAAAATSVGSKTFTWKSPTYSKTDTNGSFVAQYSAATSNHNVASATRLLHGSRR